MPEGIPPTLLILSAVLGGCMGSFLDVVARRSLEGRPWWGKERSVCDSCGHVLSAVELIPVVSWLLQRGRCRACHAPVSARYLIVELVAAAGTVSLVWRWGGVSLWACALSLAGLAGALLNALTDWESGDVFDAFALAVGAAGELIRLGGGGEALLDGALGAAAGWGVFAFIILVSRGGRGWGDACFLGGMGAGLGWKLTLLAFYLGIMLGGAGVFGLILCGRVRIGRRDSIPLVPCLAVGCYLTLLWGPQLLALLGAYLAMPAPLLPSWPFLQ